MRTRKRSPKTPKQHWFSLYWVRPEEIGEERPFETAIHKVRDMFPLHLISNDLTVRGIPYAGALLNIPERIRASRRIPEASLPLAGGDLLLQCTRPPLDDSANEVKRRISQGGDLLEETLRPSLRRIFSNCDRGDVALTAELKPDRKGAPEEYRLIKFFQENKKQLIRGGRVQLFAGGAPRKSLDSDLTIGYLVSIPRVEPLGFRFIAAFGMGGTETLWLAHLLTDTGYRCYLRDAIESEVESLWTIPFLVPAFVPYPRITTDKIDFTPRYEFAEVTKWTRD
jgi:hypothetical protein